MARPSQKVVQLANMLIRNGVVEEEALPLAKAALNSFPSLKQQKNVGDFAAIVQTLKTNAKYGTVSQGRKANKTTSKIEKGKRVEIRIGTEQIHYSVFTTLPPGFIDAALVSTLEKWVNFARGADTLGGQTLKNPSGRYASSLELREQSKSFFTIYSKSKHADVLETGHQRFDLKDYISSYGGGDFARVPIGKNSLINRTPPVRLRTAASGPRLRVYSQSNQKSVAKTYGGRYKEKDIRMMSANAPAASWQIPAMRAYSPAWHLAQKLQREFKFEERLLQ